MIGMINGAARALCCVAVLELLCPARLGHSAEAVTVSFSLQQARATLHEPVYVNFSVQNNLPEGIIFDLGFDAKVGFSFWVREPGGTKAKLPAYSRGGLGIGGKRTLGAGKTYTQAILFNELYGPNKPGDYVIGAELAVPIETQSRRYLKSPPAVELTLQVGERDPRHLAAVCEGLAEMVIKGPEYQKAREAAFALRYVLDPVAVPHLERVLKEGNWVLAGFAATGLARIGTPDSAQALKSALEVTKNPDVRRQIEGALWEIRTGRKLEILD